MNHCYLATQMIKTLEERDFEKSYIRKWEGCLDELSTDQALVKVRNFDYENQRHLAKRLGVNVMHLVAVTEFIVEKT